MHLQNIHNENLAESHRQLDVMYPAKLLTAQGVKKHANRRQNDVSSQSKYKFA